MKRIPSSLAILQAVILTTGAWAQQAPPAAAGLTAELLQGIPLRNIGPANTPGRIADIAVDPKNDNTWYVAIASGGLWKTVNRGTSWRPLFDNYGSFSLGCVTVDPKDSNVVWLGTGENTSQRSVDFGDGLYKSIDAGQTWKRVGLEHSEHIAKILIDPRDSNTVYVAAQGPLWSPGGDRGLYKTTDGGATWKAILSISENTGVTDIALDPSSPDTLYAAAYQRRRNTGVLIGGGPEAGIFKSADAGAHFTKLEKGVPTGDLGRIALAISPQKPEVIYAWIFAGQNQAGFYKSEDKGESWARQSNPPVQDPQYYGEIYTDPHAFDHVFMVDMNGHESFDGGKTFRNCWGGIHVDHHAFWIDPKDAGHWLEGNDGGLYETYDTGRQWRHFLNIPAIQYYRVATDNALPFYNIAGGAQDNGSSEGPSRSLKRSGVFTNEWYSIGGGDGFQPRIDPEDPSTVYSFSQNGAIQRLDKRTSQSRGIRPPNNIAAGTRWNWDTPFIISSHSHTRLYMTGSKIFRSDDRGDNWVLFSPDLTRQLDRNTIPVMGKIWDNNAIARNTFTTELSIINTISESPINENTVIAGTDDGLIQITTDGGKTWTKSDAFPGVPDMPVVSCVFASNHDANTLYATFHNYQHGDFKPYVAKSTDLGKTWTNITANLPDRYFAWSIIEDYINKDLLFVGTEFGLFVSVDGGKDWTQFKGNVPTIAFRDLQIQKRESDLIAASFGRGIFILDDFTPFRAMTPAAIEKEAALFPMRRAQSYYEQTYYRSAETDEFVGPNPPPGALITYHLSRDFGTPAPAGRGARGGGGGGAGAGAATVAATGAADADAAGGGDTQPAGGGDAGAAAAGGGGAARGRGGRGGGRGGAGGTGVVLQITDAAGTIMRTLDGPGAAGLHRVTWDLRGGTPGAGAAPEGEEFDPDAGEEEETGDRPAGDADRDADKDQDKDADKDMDQDKGKNIPMAPEAAQVQPAQGETDAAGRGGGAAGGGGGTDAAGGAAAGGGGGARGGRGGGGRGGAGGGRGGFGGNLPFVKPGKYTITLGHIVNGAFTPLTDPQTVDVVPLQMTDKP